MVEVRRMFGTLIQQCMSPRISHGSRRPTNTNVSFHFLLVPPQLFDWFYSLSFRVFSQLFCWKSRHNWTARTTNDAVPFPRAFSFFKKLNNFGSLFIWFQQRLFHKAVCSIWLSSCLTNGFFSNIFFHLKKYFSICIFGVQCLLKFFIFLIIYFLFLF